MFVIFLVIIVFQLDYIYSIIVKHNTDILIVRSVLISNIISVSTMFGTIHPIVTI